MHGGSSAVQAPNDVSPSTPAVPSQIDIWTARREAGTAGQELPPAETSRDGPARVDAEGMARCVLEDPTTMRNGASSEAAAAVKDDVAFPLVDASPRRLHGEDASIRSSWKEVGGLQVRLITEWLLTPHPGIELPTG
jgi:hypothetical protein